jgi:hypothetical protein
VARVHVRRVPVVALLALRGIEDAVATRLVGAAVGRAAIAGSGVAVVADLVRAGIDDAVTAAALEAV